MNPELLKKYFSFLETDYGMICEKSQSQSWGFQEHYGNAISAVQLSYEFKEHYLYIILFRRGGPGFDLDDVASISGGAIISPDGQTVEQTIALQAEKLKTYGAPILGGDFHQFPELEKIVAERAARFS